MDFWYAGAEADYMQQLVDNGFTDALFLENTMPHLCPPGRREALHEEAKKRGLQMGVWGWHTVEIETDQNPSMHVNAQLLSHLYRQIRDGAHRIHPVTYWSEMEAYHLNNIFSHYAAAQLLWNPDRDPDELRREIAEGIWGPRNGPAMLAALRLIQDVRTGPTWDTYWIFLPTYRLGTPAEGAGLDAMARCEPAAPITAKPAAQLGDAFRVQGRCATTLAGIPVANREGSRSLPSADRQRDRGERGRGYVSARELGGVSLPMNGRTTRPVSP